ncbi:MAG: NADP-dependent isocitrate dehydrogenase, partial [Thermoplasmata archaeon]
NGTIRAILDGTVFRKPIMVKNIKPVVSNWKKPIIVGRHAYGDVYKNAEIKVSGKGKGELVFTDENGKETRILIQEFKSPGILQGIHNLDSSIQSFARSCMTYALDQNMDLWFGVKDTISKTYDGNFKKIFTEIYEKEFKEKFEKSKINFSLTLIDDTVARVMRSEGGFLWACKNYDGDVMSDMVASAFGSLAMMTSVLVSPNGWFEYEAAHGTVQKHYYKYKAGEKTSTNPTALIFAWTGALKKRAQIDSIPELEKFADKLEAATIMTVEEGYVTKDLEKLCEPAPKKVLLTEEFLDKVKETLDKNL